MVLHFNERRATEAAAKFLELCGGHMNWLKLIRLLYLARPRGPAALAPAGHNRPLCLDGGRASLYLVRTGTHSDLF